MLRANLSTRPFYNERLVRLALVLVGAIAVALTVYDVSQIVALTRRSTELAARTAAAETRARALREQGRDIRQALSSSDVEAVRAAAVEANALIERRAFSWTELFNRFEETLPADVRVIAVQPQVDQEGRLLVVITTMARRVEDVDAFIGRLEEAGGFSGVLSRQEETQDDGTLRSVIQGYYAATSSRPSSESTGGGR
ncbi:MAG: hypothetical protein AB1635_19345 [Acidobacteriota bacterium]